MGTVAGLLTLRRLETILVLCFECVMPEFIRWELHT
jgi:hypothetical protein